MYELNSTILWTALVTPLKDSGEVDFASLRQLIENQENAGNGILVLGSTGEAMSFSLKERQEILEFVIDLKSDIPIMVGVGGTNIEDSREWIGYLNGLNVDAYLLVTPLYFKPGFQGQLGWFQDLLDRANKPCMLYNVPSRTGISLNVDTVRELSSHRNFWALKEASGSIDDYRGYRDAINGEALLFSGDDAMMPHFARLGCSGCVSVASNVWPEETRQYVEDCLHGEDLDEIWEHACKSLFVVTNPIPVKGLLETLGVISTPKLRLPLSNGDLSDTKVLMLAHGEVREWYTRRLAEMSRSRHENKPVGYRISLAKKERGNAGVLEVQASTELRTTTVRES